MSDVQQIGRTGLTHGTSSLTARLAGRRAARHQTNGAAATDQPVAEQSGNADDAGDESSGLASLRLRFFVPPDEDNALADDERMHSVAVEAAGALGEQAGGDGPAGAVPLPAEDTAVPANDAGREAVEQASEDAAGLRRRYEREVVEATDRGKRDALVGLLAIVDDLERALGHVPEHLRADPWVQGVLMVGDAVDSVLAQQGVERVTPLNAAFDPRAHEALSRVEVEDGPTNRVVAVYRPGFMMNGRMLRPAQVQVAVRKERE